MPKKIASSFKRILAMANDQYVNLILEYLILVLVQFIFDKNEID